MAVLTEALFVRELPQLPTQLRKLDLIWTGGAYSKELTKDLTLTVILPLVSVHCPFLTELNLLNGYPGVMGLAGLRLPKLTNLQLEDCELTNLEGLHIKCPVLTNLNVRCCFEITGLEDKCFSLLTDLNLSMCYELASFKGLQCPMLANLNLDDCFELTSLKGLQCPMLANLNLEGCSSLTSLEGLRFPKLINLNLKRCFYLARADLADLVALQFPLVTNLKLIDGTDIEF
jgi:hypothetical protein